MAQLQKMVSLVTQACQATDLTTLMLGGDAASQTEQSIVESRPAAAPPRMQADWRSSDITSRADVQLALEKVKQYFARYEPSHPAPLMIDRVQRVIELDFMEIIRDLAPDGVHQLENIFGRRD